MPEASLADIPHQLPSRPSAVLVVSGHWDAPQFRVMGTANPPMAYDYRGFPTHTCSVHYRASGAPDVACHVQQLRQSASNAIQIDEQYGCDHRTFAPIVVIYPDADVPVLTLSLKAGYDPAQHLAIGRALAPLRDEGVLIIGSGPSYHDPRLMGQAARLPSTQFDH